MLWDIFCRVVDNFGDIGVSWRLSADLAQRGHRVRLWIDDASALSWMAPGALQNEWAGIQVLDWTHSHDPALLQQLHPADVWIEAFGCEIPADFVAFFTPATRPKDLPVAVWINLEYLTAEAYVERSHALPSPVLHGPGAGRTKYFFYPGFTTKTGGLLRESAIGSGHPAAEPDADFLQKWGVNPKSGPVVSLFCYEPAALPDLLSQLAQREEPVQLLVTAGRATRAVQQLLDDTRQSGQLTIIYLPPLSQVEFDSLLCSCNLNFVRGEDSVVRAIWAGVPFVWQIYPQDDGADGPKLEAFMETLQFSPAVRALHRYWNGMTGQDQPPAAWQALERTQLHAWQQEVRAARARLLKMDDLTTQLLHFVAKKR